MIKNIFKKEKFNKNQPIATYGINPIVLTAGGTGGHIVPAMKVASDLIKAGNKVIFITDRRFKRYEPIFSKYSFFTSSNLKVVITPIRSFNGSPNILTFVLDILFSCIKSFFIICKYNPKLFIGFGGYVSFPPLAMAIFTFRDVVIHEQNAVFGRVNKMFLKSASSILFSFPDTSFLPKKQYKKIQDKLIISGLPNFLNQETNGTIGYKIIHDIAVKPEIVILITGGGQGASFFSDNIPPSIILLAKTFPHVKFKIFHQVREVETKEVKAVYDNSGLSNLEVIIDSLFKDIPALLLIADFAIIRGGAASIIETATARVFPIVIPMPNSVDDHQIKNATILAKNNAGIMISQADYAPQKIVFIISKAMRDGLFYFPIINNASELFKKNSTDVFLNVILYSDLDFIYYGKKK